MRARLLSITVAVLALTAQVEESPTIRVTTRLVELNVIARGKDGPVRGLTRDDFTIFDNGKPRPVSFFSVHSAPDLVEQRTRSLPSNVFTNRPPLEDESPTTATIVLLDGVNTEITDQTHARKQFIDFVKQIRPLDRIAVYALGRRQFRILNDFTTDAARLVASLERYRGELDDLVNDPDRAWAMDARVRLTTEALQAIAQHVGHLPGRKNLIWVSASFPFTTTLEVGQPRFRTFAREVFRSTRALNDADIAVYPVDARGLVGMPGLSAAGRAGGPPSSPPGQDTMHAIARETGGRVFTSDNDIRGAIGTVLADSELTYTLGFYPDPALSDGEYRNITVKVNRRDVDLRYRRGYVASSQEALAQRERSARIRESMLSPLLASRIALTGEVEIIGGSKRLMVTASCRDITLEPQGRRWAGAIETVISQRAADGRDLGTWVYRQRLDMNDEQRANALRNGIRVAHQTVAPVAGAVELKIVVLDNLSGRLGSLVVPVQTE